MWSNFAESHAAVHRPFGVPNLKLTIHAMDIENLSLEFDFPRKNFCIGIRSDRHDALRLCCAAANSIPMNRARTQFAMR